MSNIFQNLSKASFWFYAPFSDSWELKIYLVIFLALAIASVICYIVFTKKSKHIQPYEKVKNLTFGWLLGFSLTGLALVFFIWQAIPYLSTRILLIALFLAILIWLVYLSIYLNFSFKEELENFYHEQEFKKYLPTKKQRK